MAYEGSHLDEALKAFGRVVELQPDNWLGYMMRGIVLQTRGRLAEAEADYRRAIALGGDSSAHSNLGALFYQQGRFEEAVKTFRESVRLEPQEPANHRNLGDALAHFGRRAEARQEYREAARLIRGRLEVNPNDGLAMRCLPSSRRRRAGQGRPRSTQPAPASWRRVRQPWSIGWR